MLDLCIFGLLCGNTIVIFEILEFGLLENLAQKKKKKKKKIKIGTKNVKFGYFLTGILKYYCDI